ncbi:MAG: peroxide stress protein YaaA [Luteibaculaceae bacterium]
MLILISPAKNLDETALEAEKVMFTLPKFIDDARILVKEARKLSPIKLSELMSVSESIANLNYKRFEQWYAPFTPKNSKQAIFCFNGDVYQGLNAKTLTESDLEYAQNKLRILSGLYGLLRPLDLMQAYRLEMGLPFKNERGKDLYQFWDNKLTESLNEELELQKENFVINLASNEYFKAIQTKNLKAEVITPTFKDKKDSDYKVISFYAKKARGEMARFIIQNKIEKAEDLQGFTEGNYYYSEEHSKPNEPVFLREH